MKRCDHNKKELRKKQRIDGNWICQYQCTECFFIFGTAIKRPNNFMDLNDIDEYTYKANKEKEEAKEEDEKIKNDSAAKLLDDKKYSKYLETDQWKKLREKVFIRDKGICQGCGLNTENKYVIHHLNYDHKYAEFLFQLVLLCPSCHNEYHGHKHRPIWEADGNA